MKSRQSDFPASGFRRKLLSWYDRNRRDLPWRRSSDPYCIWLSEVMLQQTRVETVIPYYHRFLAVYPSLERLAAAGEDDVLKLWEGLGYYSRARNFLAAVKEVQDGYGGKVPDDPAMFASLKGVGEYTCAAVGSIAFGRTLAVVDGNVRRVLCRLFCLEEDPKTAGAQKEISRLASELLDRERPGDYNQAVMELGALVCTPRSPRCASCPVAGCCRGHAAGKAESLPQKGIKKALPVNRLAAVVLQHDTKVLVRQRQESLLKGLWEFPSVLWEGDRDALPYLFAGLPGGTIDIGEEMMRLTHTFSHLQWDVTVFGASQRGMPAVGFPWRLLEPAQLEMLAFPAVYKPVLKAIMDKNK